ncbi:MAG: hypothetical protein ACKPEY_02600, partial [Planctomycetota bacterium]
MTTLFFVLLSVVLFSICVALVVILSEAKEVTRGIIERWREAIAQSVELSNLRQRLTAVEAQLSVARGRVAPLVTRMIQEKHAEVCEEVGPGNHHQLVHQFGEFLTFLDSHGQGVTVDHRRALFAEIELANERARRLAEEKARQAEIKAR